MQQLDNKVGYIELSHFADPEWARDTLASVMNQMESSHALIIDLINRYNHGGSPYMGVLLASYFFQEPVHWVDLKSRNHLDLNHNFAVCFSPLR